MKTAQMNKSNDPFEALKHLHSVEPSAHLWEQLQSRRYVRPIHLWTSAAMIAVLISVQLLQPKNTDLSTFNVSPSEQLYHEAQ